MRTEWKGKGHKLDLVMDLGKPWPYEDNSVDGIVGMHVFQQLYWRDLLVAFREARRVLKEGGVLRMGVPMVEITDKSLDYILGWNNVNLFSVDLLRQVLIERLGFAKLLSMPFGVSTLQELAVVDNRENRGTMYFDVIR